MSSTRDEAWRLFIDAESGLVLGPPESLVAQANAYYFTDSAAASQPIPTVDPLLPFDHLETALAPYYSGLETASGVRLNLATFPDASTPPSPTHIEAANIAVHTSRTLTQFMGACGVHADQFKQYGFSYTKRRANGARDTIAGTQIQPLLLVVGITGGDTLQMGFVSDEQTNPKPINFQTLPMGQHFTVDGKPVHNPSLDPELICHEVTHTVMWLVDRLPFIENGNSVPCRQALLEGYATYFARSLAARGGGATDLWAASVYRETDGWADRWGLAGSPPHANPDSLPGVNQYPAGANVGVGIYDLSMVWARALWDIRSLLAADPAWGPVQGPNMADRLALEGYIRCHGSIINFLIAANGMVDSTRKTPALSTQLITKMQAAFVNRRIM